MNFINAICLVVFYRLFSVLFLYVHNDVSGCLPVCVYHMKLLTYCSQYIHYNSRLLASVVSWLSWFKLVYMSFN